MMVLGILSIILYTSVRIKSAFLTYPHMTPTVIPMSASATATESPINRDVLVPAQILAHRSWPMELVPRRNWNAHVLMRNMS